MALTPSALRVVRMTTSKQSPAVATSSVELSEMTSQLPGMTTKCSARRYGTPFGGTAPDADHVDLPGLAAPEWLEPRGRRRDCAGWGGALKMRANGSSKSTRRGAPSPARRCADHRRGGRLVT